MPPTTPLFLVDNDFDTVTQYVSGTLSSSGEIVGHEAYRVADGRRDRTWWQPPSAAANHYIQVDLGSIVTRAVDFLWLDRGHNLWGKTVAISHATAAGGPYTAAFQLVLPAVGTLGGNPTTGWSVTEEGACYALFTASAVFRYWRFIVVDNMQPLVTGLMAGLRHQLIGYPTARDEDGGERTQRLEESTAGYRATGKSYSWHRMDVPTRLIGATEYDATIRDFRRRLFEQNNPAFVAIDYGLTPERGWLYQFDGTRWSATMDRVYRATTIPLREVGARVT